jgi:hypothetical protein
MSVAYKNYPIKIDGSSVLDEAWSVVFGKTDAAMNYEAAVTAELDTLTKRSGGVGQRILDALPKDKNIVIVPYDGNGGNCNAWANDATVFERGQARVCFSPSTWTVGGMCVPTATGGVGDKSDEILLHELLHAFRKVRGTYNRAPFHKTPDKLYDDVEELWAILITNIYMSEKGSVKFRRDHAGFVELPAKWATSDSFMRDPDFFNYLELFWIRESAVLGMIAAGPAAFNPVKAYKALKDAQEAAKAASW